jgi:hypothetical protein
MEDLTVIFFSCHRLGVLERVISAFNKFNTYPVREFIIVNDSGDQFMHAQLKQLYPEYTLILNETNEGVIKSMDIGYSQIKTEYFFSSEDDLEITKCGFIERSLSIMQERSDIEEVWLANWNTHPTEELVYRTINNVYYKLIQDNYMPGDDGNAWHGFSMACALKRMSDYRKVAPYADIPYHDTIWHREQAIGEAYHKLGYRTAILLEDYVKYIGYGISEYKTGYEK